VTAGPERGQDCGGPRHRDAMHAFGQFPPCSRVLYPEAEQPARYRNLQDVAALQLRGGRDRRRGAGNNGPVSTATASSFLNAAGTIGG
jgi:hypothetical protein